ncbi:MAG: TIGR02996 domain-containing protein [Archangium sp.]|nr:TIGR02996 domain-containing protein [Archangium sp.]
MKLHQVLQQAATDPRALLDAWWLNPHPRISAVIGTLPEGAPFAGDVDAWCVALRTTLRAQLGPLFAVLFEGKVAEVQRRLELLSGWSDARLANHLERVLREVPWSSNGARRLWTQIFSLVTSSKDPRFVALAQELPPKWGLRSAQQEWMTRAFTQAVRSLPAVTELTPEESALLQVIEREAFAARPPLPKSRTIDFSAVYAAPHDDAPRLVLADALLEQAAPRGELLSLQLRATKTAAEERRERALLKAHAKTWLAPFGPSLGAEVTWRRGFPAEGLVKFRNAADVEKYGGLTEWATFEALTWSPPRSPEHQLAAGFIGPAFRHLLSADDVHVPHLLASGAVTWALRKVRGAVENAEGLRAVLESKTLPKLEALHVTDTPFTAQWLDGVKWGALQEFGVATRYPPLLLHVLAAVEASPLKRLQWGRALRFHRADDGTLSKLELLDWRGAYRVDEQLGSLPAGAVSSLVAPADRHWSTGPLGRALERVVKQQRHRPSVARSAALHLGLNGVRSIAWGEGRVWVSDGQLLRAVDAKTLEVAASFPGGFVAEGGRDVLRLQGDRVELCELRTGALRTVYEGKNLQRLVRSSDGTRAAVRQGAKVRVLEVATGAVCFECSGEEPELDARGARLIVRSRQQVELHDVETKAKQVIEGWPFAPNFLADGRLIQRRDGIARIGEVAFPTNGEHAWHACSTTDGARVAIVHPGATFVFDGHSGRKLAQHEGGWAGIFAPDGTLFIAANDRLTRV